MRILLINPNTSQSFTDKIQAIAQKYALPSYPGSCDESSVWAALYRKYLR